MVLAVTGNSFMVLDPKSYALKYRVDLSNLEQISLSPYSDAIFVMHVKPVSIALLGTCPCNGIKRGMVHVHVVLLLKMKCTGFFTIKDNCL